MSDPAPERKSRPKARREAGIDAPSSMRRRVVPAVLAMILALAVVDGVFGERGLLANMHQRQRNAAHQAAVDELTTLNATLTEEIRRLREDPAAIEELAREELGLIKDGELLIIMRDAMPPSQTPATPQPR